jgi:LacI family transcriptional regulator
MAQRITMSDVADKAGVSLMTVSRVVNHKGDVNAETRKRIEQIIAELGFRPSGIARSLATQQTRTIGLVIPDVSNPFFAEITRGVENLANDQGYHVFLCNTEENPQRELAVIRSLEEKRVDGLILCSSRIEEQNLLELLGRLPAAVLINRRLSAPEDDSLQSVILDDEASGRIATAHLLGRGHQKIGYLAGPAASYSGQWRQKGYQAALQSAGLDFLPGWIRRCSPSVEGGCLAALELLAAQPELSAIFCYNDLVAVGVLQACRTLNLRIPQDLAVVGHDDIRLAALVSPSLTTCRVACQELGEYAVQALIERIRDCPGGCQKIVLKPELILRESAP